MGQETTPPSVIETRRKTFAKNGSILGPLRLGRLAVVVITGKVRTFRTCHLHFLSDLPRVPSENNYSRLTEGAFCHALDNWNFGVGRHRNGRQGRRRPAGVYELQQRHDGRLVVATGVGRRGLCVAGGLQPDARLLRRPPSLLRQRLGRLLRPSSQSRSLLDPRRHTPIVLSGRALSSLAIGRFHSVRTMYVRRGAAHAGRSHARAGRHAHAAGRARQDGSKPVQFPFALAHLSYHGVPLLARKQCVGSGLR